MTLTGLLKSYAKYSIPPMAKYGKKIYVAIQIEITKNKNEISNSLFLNDEFIIKSFIRSMVCFNVRGTI